MAEGKLITFGREAQSKIIEGVEKAAGAISKTLGPAGKCVCIYNGAMGVEISRDGATVAKSISFKDPELDAGAQLLRKAATLSESLAGDSTSTTSILIKELCLKGQKAINSGANVNSLKAGMLKAGKRLEEYIKTKSIPVDGDLEKIRKVATVSANGNGEIGDLIVQSIEKVGTQGVITADLAAGLDTVISIEEGMKLNRGFASPHFINNAASGKCTLEDVYVLVVGEKISTVNQILGILEVLVKSHRPFLIVCDDADEPVVETLAYNVLSGSVSCALIKGIDFGDSRKNLMQDIAIATGGTYLCPENGKSVSDAGLEDLGAAKRVVLTQSNTIIYGFEGDKEAIKRRVDILQARVADPTISDYEKTKFTTRIANLVAGISVIKAGGATEAEKLNLKATIEDAILAVRGSIEEGVCPGCGYTYLKGTEELKKDTGFWKGLTEDERLGAEIICSALPVIMRTVVENAGVSGDVVLDTVMKSKKENYGFNAKTKKFVNLVEDGVLDSTKAIRVALENAISTAAMILLTDCSIFEDRTEE